MAEEDEFDSAAHSSGHDEAQVSLCYGGFWLRFGAILIDGAMLGFAAVVAYMFLALLIVDGTRQYRWSNQQCQWLERAFYVVIGIVVWLYFALAESSGRQATPGKLAMGLCVTDLNGERLPFRQATRRFFAKNVTGWISPAALWVAPIFPAYTKWIIAYGASLGSAVALIGFSMAGVTPRKQALHDFLSRSLVVRWRAPADDSETEDSTSPLDF